MSQNRFTEILQENREMATIDLIELIYWLADHVRRILAAALAGAMLMALYSFVIASPVYKATSVLYVLNSSDSAINLSDLQIGSYLTSDYREVFDMWEVKEMVLQRLDLDYSYGKLGSMLEVSNPTNTRMLYITVSSESPEEAAQMANAYAEVAREYISATMQTDTPSLMSQALTPTSPVLPRKKLNLFLGAVAGAFLMTLVLMVQFILDDKLKTNEDIARYLQTPVLAVVPENRKTPSRQRRAPVQEREE